MTNASQNSSNKIKIKSVISALIQLGCLTGLLYFAGNSISTYCRYDTRALIKIKNSSDETYIAFTICPKLEDFNSDTLSNYGINAHRYIWQGNFTGNSSGENAWDIFQKVTYNLENLIRTTERPALDLASKNPTNVIHIPPEPGRRRGSNGATPITCTGYLKVTPLKSLTSSLF